jgi:FlaG/FlaF family flagellin (archaellin)
MKKIIAILAALAICISMTACGSTKSDDTSSDAASDETSSVESVASEETALETYVNGDDFQQTIAELSVSYESQGISLLVKAEGNSLIYTCQYTGDIDTESTKAVLEEYLASDTTMTTFSGLLTSIKLYAPDTESVVVEYTDKDGNLITSYEYK